eukprot:1814039-Pyramimonas_sp.AAC.1
MREQEGRPTCASPTTGSRAASHGQGFHLGAPRRGHLLGGPLGGSAVQLASVPGVQSLSLDMLL